MGRITRSCIDKIMDAIRIEEVVGDFVQLKKSGSSFRGLSPFTQEKTPSFYVVPSKGIFKDFSSGKGGSAVTFLMEHEQMTYPEALKWLASKYNIEVEEEAMSAEQQEAETVRESLFAVSAWAAKQFSEWMWEDPDARAVGLAYFKSRGYTEETIKKFELGFAKEGRHELYDAATAAGYQSEFLIDTGLCIAREQGKAVDRFWGRAMFPIHSMSGRIIGFGGRVLKKDAKTAKYLNSPESEIYHKSKVLYGLYQSKSSIAKLDRCLVVEGYTDVISMHQAGVQNVVSSSGTALTKEQIRLIQRLTQHVTLLFDGDAAGLKAAFRGIDLILAEGLSVRAVALPEGEDPDSMALRLGGEGMQAFLQEHEQDFLAFKAGVLLADAGDDPAARSEAIQSLVSSLAIIGDAITRGEYIKATAKNLNIQEQDLRDSVNREMEKNHREATRQQQRDRDREMRQSAQTAPVQNSGDPYEVPMMVAPEAPSPSAHRPPAVEEDLIHALISYGQVEIAMELPGEEEPVKDLAGAFILDELMSDALDFTHGPFQKIFTLYAASWESKEMIISQQDILAHGDQELAAVMADMLTEEHELSDWERSGIYVKPKDHDIDTHVQQCLWRFKDAWVDRELKKQSQLLNSMSEEAKQEALQTIIRLQALRNSLRQLLHRVL